MSRQSRFRVFRRLRPLFVVALLWIARWVAAPCPAAVAVSDEALMVTRDTQLDPAKTYGRIVIKASDIVIDGHGAWVIGATHGDPKTFTGEGISADGVSGVTLKNVNAKGWEIGLHIQNGRGWTVEGCNFSDNFHDPAIGWEWEGRRRGGILLNRVTKSTLRKNTANRVWDACSLLESDDNLLDGNDFSHTSDTCLKLWTSCRNQIHKNNLSWGLRIAPGETHARDSACVLVEAGSNDNHFLDNDITHGGDGVFVRSLNGWVSSGNVFERNDASYAQNNCIEAQSPRNIYRGNKANHGSHGIWVGISDETILENNEVCYNGVPTGHHNAPWHFSYAPYAPQEGAAGIIFAGPCSHTIVRGNKCIGNNGAGICAFGDASPKHRFKVFHWILEKNVVRDNRWGIYMEFSDWIDMADNVCEDNRESNLIFGGVVTNVTEHSTDPHIRRSPRAVLTGPSFGQVGQEIPFDASGSADPDGALLSFRWDLGDGTIVNQSHATHVFETPGFYRVGVTVTNGRFSDVAFRDFRVVDAAPELGTEAQAADWTWEEIYPRDGLHVPVNKPRDVEPARPVSDPKSKVQITDDPQSFLAGKSSLALFVQPSGNPLSLLYPRAKNAGILLAGKKNLVFWYKALNPNLHAWKGLMPTVTIYESDKKFAMLRPFDDARNYVQNNEDRANWSYLAIPLAGNAQWKLQGQLPAKLNYMTIEFYPWGGLPYHLWIDGMSLQ